MRRHPRMLRDPHHAPYRSPTAPRTWSRPPTPECHGHGACCRCTPRNIYRLFVASLTNFAWKPASCSSWHGCLDLAQTADLGVFQRPLTLILCISKPMLCQPMVCIRVALHENNGHHENAENDEDNSESNKLLQTRSCQ